MSSVTMLRENDKRRWCRGRLSPWLAPAIRNWATQMPSCVHLQFSNARQDLFRNVHRQKKPLIALIRSAQLLVFDHDTSRPLLLKLLLNEKDRLLLSYSQTMN